MDNSEESFYNQNYICQKNKKKVIKIGINNIKYTQEYVESFYKERNCILLDEYIGSNTPMNYICHCGHKNILSFYKFRQQKHGCRYCTKIGGYTYDEVFNYFRENNCELLSETYDGVKEKLKYRCSCGNISEISFDNFKNGKRCYLCGLNKLSEQNREDINYVRKYFINNNCVPLFDDYRNDRQKLKYQCVCGNIATISFADFKVGVRCKKCAKERCMKTLYNNGNQICSTQQEYLFKITGGILNYPSDNFSLDIAFPEDKLYIEYDGSGHELGIKLGAYTEEQFQEKEKRRNYILYKLGWKSIRIVSKKDKLPTELKIIEMINLSKEILKERSWIIFDIDDSKLKYKNFEQEYNFGEIKRLRRD